jgi:hypothetical protein
MTSKTCLLAALLCTLAGACGSDAPSHVADATPLDARTQNELYRPCTDGAQCVGTGALCLGSSSSSDPGICTWRCVIDGTDPYDRATCGFEYSGPGQPACALPNYNATEHYCGIVCGDEIPELCTDEQCDGSCPAGTTCQTVEGFAARVCAQ